MTGTDAVPGPEVKRRGLLRRVGGGISRLFPSRLELRAHRAPLLMCLVSGLFGALIFHHNFLGLLGWIALIPYFMAVHRLRGKMLAWGTMLFGFTWYYLGLFWLHSLIVFSLLIPLGVFVGSVYVAAYFLLFAFPAAWCMRNLPAALRPWTIAICWTAIEYLRNFTDMAFPWNLLGHSQAPFNTLHMPLASIGGVYLISFLMALFSAAIAVAAVESRRRSTSFGRAVVAMRRPIIFVAAASVFAAFIPAISGGDSLKASVIQPGISQLQKWDALMGVPGDTQQSYEQRFRETDILMQETAGNLIREAARQDKPELIVLPESVFLSAYFPYETELHEQLASMSRELRTDLFFGADNRIQRTLYDELAASGQRFLLPGDTITTMPLPTLPLFTNNDGTTMPNFQQEPPMAATVAAWHVSQARGLEPRVYNKMQLVPFGEMVPFVSGFDWLRDTLEASGIAGAFKPGMQNTIFETAGVKFGTVICFESTFSHLTRHLSKAGAQFITVLTNDAWYDPQYAISEGGFWGTLFKIPGIKQLAAAGPKQHFIHSQFRAIETGRPVVRSANSGISALVDYNGNVEEELDYGKSGFISGTITVPTNGAQTLSVRWGEWVGLLCAGFWLALAIGGILSGGKHARPK